MGNLNREQYFAYMEGWKHGAATRALDPKFAESERAEISAAYKLGYTRGYHDRKKAQVEASKIHDYMPEILRTQEGVDPSEAPG